MHIFSQKISTYTAHSNKKQLAACFNDIVGLSLQKDRIPNKNFQVLCSLECVQTENSLWASLAAHMLILFNRTTNLSQTWNDYLGTEDSAACISSQVLPSI